MENTQYFVPQLGFWPKKKSCRNSRKSALSTTALWCRIEIHYVTRGEMGNLTTGLLSKSVVSFGLYSGMNEYTYKARHRDPSAVNVHRNKFHNIYISINKTQFPKHLNPKLQLFVDIYNYNILF